MKMFTDQLIEEPAKDRVLDTRESFWNYVLRSDSSTCETLFAQLERMGIPLHAPESLGDGEVTGKLWEVIQGLASVQVFLNETDHLSDRELYSELWHHILREERKAVAWDRRSAYHIDILGGCSQREMHLYLQYYADEDFRRQWKMDFPQDPIPEAEKPPYDRDRFLPQPYYGPPITS
jgi:hypothetical protein